MLSRCRAACWTHVLWSRINSVSDVDEVFCVTNGGGGVAALDSGHLNIQPPHTLAETYKCSLKPCLKATVGRSSPSSWAVVKAEGRPSSSITEQLLFGSHMVPTSAMPRVSQVEAPHRSCTKHKPQTNFGCNVQRCFVSVNFWLIVLFDPSLNHLSTHFFLLWGQYFQKVLFCFFRCAKNKVKWQTGPWKLTWVNGVYCWRVSVAGWVCQMS